MQINNELSRLLDNIIPHVMLIVSVTSAGYALMYTLTGSSVPQPNSFVTTANSARVQFTTDTGVSTGSTSGFTIVYFQYSAGRSTSEQPLQS